MFSGEPYTYVNGKETVYRKAIVLKEMAQFKE